MSSSTRSSSDGASAPATISLRALGSTAVLATADPDALRPARAILVRALRALDLACSRFRPDAELVALNRAAGRAVPVGDLLWEALEAACHVARITGGLVDPTLGRSLRAVGYDRTFVRVRLGEGAGGTPTFQPGGRWRELELDGARRTVRVPSGVELDLGATAKAFAADRIATESAACTGTGVLVSLGGDIAVAGRPPGHGWGVRIADDHRADLDGAGPVVALAEGGIATSGTAVRRWRRSGGELHHIIDPPTGRPARTPWRTVSVAAATCLDANAASTAAVVLGDQAPAWLSERSLPARLVRGDGSVVHVAGWPHEPEARAA